MGFIFIWQRLPAAMVFLQFPRPQSGGRGEITAVAGGAEQEEGERQREVVNLGRAIQV